MKKLIQWMLVLGLAFSFFVVAEQASASTAKDKVYSEYSLPSAAKKFPIKMTNGLTVATAKVNGKVVPVIKKGSKTVWQGKALATNSKIRFTVTKNNDTFLYYMQSVSGAGNIDVIGVNKSGKVFLNEVIKDESRLRVDFISASVIDVAIEYNYGFISNFYQLYKDGSVKELQYFDKAFATQAKNGQLKYTSGAIGTTYKNLQPKVAYLDGKPNFGEIEMYNTWKLAYGFLDGKKYGKLEPTQKVEMLLYRNILAETYDTKTALRKYIGKPVSTYDNVESYKVGKYYLIVTYNENTYVTLELVSKNFAGFYGL